MPPARKCRRTTCASPVPELPVCLLLEIAARTDAATIFRCAATCKLLRREILSADFVRRVCQGPDAVVPSRTTWVLGDTTISVLRRVTPDTAAAAAAVTLERHFARQAATGLLRRYEAVRSRNGLVVLRRRSLQLGWWSDDSERLRPAADLCVYDPMTDARAFLPSAPDIDGDRGVGVHLIDQCALLTAADGIVGCSFMLVAADMARNLRLDCGASSSARVRVQTAVASSDSGLRWGAVKTVDRHPCPRWCTNLDAHSDAAVVVGGVVHWLIHCGISSSPYLQAGVVGEHVLAYDANAAALGSVDVPMGMDRPFPDPQREHALPSRLASSPDGKRLSFVVADHRMVLVWVLSSGGGGGSSWARHMQIDMAAPERRPVLQRPWRWTDDRRRVELESFLGDPRSGAAVLLRFCGARFVLDMETGATCQTCLGGDTGIPYEVDLASRLSSMKSL